jgi:hypothetical protein
MILTETEIRHMTRHEIIALLDAAMREIVRKEKEKKQQ